MNPNVTAKLTSPGGLATRLRALRARSGLTQAEVADAVGVDQSKASRMERGQLLPTPEDVEAWARATDARNELDDLLDAHTDALTEQQTWRRRTRKGHVAVQTEYDKLVAESKFVRFFETAVVPGLLQTWDYAHWVAQDVIRVHGDPKDQGPEALADVKLARTRHLDDTSKRFEFLLAEPVLLWLPCPREVMVDQLASLDAASRRSNVRLGVLPLRKPITLWPQNSFVIYDSTTKVEGFVLDEAYEGDITTQYERILEMLWADAVEGDEARQLIVSAAQSLQ